MRETRRVSGLRGSSVSGESSVSEEPGANFFRHFRMIGSMVFSTSALFILIVARPIAALSRENRNERPDPGWPHLALCEFKCRGSIENGHSYFQIMVNRAGLEPATR